MPRAADRQREFAQYCQAKRHTGSTADLSNLPHEESYRTGTTQLVLNSTTSISRRTKASPRQELEERRASHFSESPSSADSLLLVPVPHPSWSEESEIPSASPSTPDPSAQQDCCDETQGELEEGLHASLDANEIKNCRLEGKNAQTYAGCLIVADRPVQVPFSAARNQITGVTATEDNAVLVCGPRLLSEAAWKMMLETQAGKAHGHDGHV